MARSTIAALLLLLAIVSVDRCGAESFFSVEGKVCCDTCAFGYYNKLSNFIQGAKVKVMCRSRVSSDEEAAKVVAEGFTDESGKYSIPVNGDHQKDICDAVLDSSPLADCAQIQPGCDKSRLALTHYNGMPSDTRNANTMCFVANKPADAEGCQELLQLYQTESRRKL